MNFKGNEGLVGTFMVQSFEENLKSTIIHIYMMCLKWKQV